MLSNSEFIVMLNQAATDRIELAKLLNISDRQLSYITNVGAGCGLIKVGSSLVPFENKFPKDTELYRCMTTKPSEMTHQSANAGAGQTSQSVNPARSKEEEVLKKIQDVCIGNPEFGEMVKRYLAE